MIWTLLIATLLVASHGTLIFRWRRAVAGRDYWKLVAGSDLDTRILNAMRENRFFWGTSTILASPDKTGARRHYALYTSGETEKDGHLGDIRESYLALVQRQTNRTEKLLAEQW